MSSLDKGAFQGRAGGMDRQQVLDSLDGSVWFHGGGNVSKQSRQNFGEKVKKGSAGHVRSRVR